MAADLALFARADPADAIARAEEAIALARQVGDPGVEVVGNAILGSALVARGDVEAGLQRLDDCASLAAAEEFELMIAPGWALCHTVSVCTNVGDFGRAGQWCRALHTTSTRWQVNRVGAEHSPLAGRESRFIVHPLMLWEDEADDARCIAFGRAVRDDMAPWSTGATYPNFLGQERTARMSAAYGASTQRLATVKRAWDPRGVFRTHQALRDINRGALD